MSLNIIIFDTKNYYEYLYIVQRLIVLCNI